MKDADLLKDYFFPESVEKKLNKITSATNSTDEEKIEQIIEVLIKYVPNLFERLTGIKVEIDPKKKPMIDALVKGAMIGFIEAQEKASKLPADAYCEKLKLITAPFLNIYNAEEVNKTRAYGSIFEYFNDHFDRMLFFNPGDSFFVQTRLKDYRKELYCLLDLVLSKLDSTTTYQQLIKNETFQSEYLLGSRKFIAFGDSYEFLNKKFRRITGKDIERLIEIYYDLAETAAKLLPVIRILIDSIEGKMYRNLDEIYRDSLRNHVQKILNSKDFSSLGELEVVIRNSISHKTFSFDIRLKRIIFKDRKSIIVRTPTEFVAETRNLSALVITLGNLQIYESYKRNLQILNLCFPFIISHGSSS